MTTRVFAIVLSVFFLVIVLTIVAVFSTTSAAATATPSRSYDASTGVTCYSVPGAISCVRTTEP